MKSKDKPGQNEVEPEHTPESSTPITTRAGSKLGRNILSRIVQS